METFLHRYILSLSINPQQQGPSAYGQMSYTQTQWSLRLKQLIPI